jgi:hypothetical protein
MAVIRKLWWGQYSLSKAFWGFYVFGFIGFALLVAVIDGLTFPFHGTGVGFVLGIAIVYLYGVIASVGVWRSASAYKANRVWPALAKAIVCIAIARVVWFLANGGALELFGRFTSTN